MLAVYAVCVNLRAMKQSSEAGVTNYTVQSQIRERLSTTQKVELTAAK